MRLFWRGGDLLVDVLVLELGKGYGVLGEANGWVDFS